MLITEKNFQGFIKGQGRSFEVIFNQYYKTLVSFAIRYGLEKMEAEDVVIEIMHHIWEMRGEVRSAAGLHVLFYTSVRNRALTILRDSRNRGRIIEENRDQFMRQETENLFYERLREEEMGRIWNVAIEKLPPQCRQVVLALLEGKSISEIAEEMTLSMNTVKTYKLRAVESLREILKDHPFLFFFVLTF